MAQIDVDINALYSLKGAINRTSKNLSNIGKLIDSYLHETLARLQKAIDYFQEKLNVAQREVDKAQTNLYEAESAYNSCLRSQREMKDDDGHIYYVPSCSFQAARVSLCRKAVQQAEKVRDAWKQKVEAAERIKNDCEREIDRYNDPGGFVHPSGGKGILIYLSETHSPKASSKLDDIINAVQDILSFSFETGERSYTSSSEVINEMQDRKREKFEEGKKKVEERIEELTNKDTTSSIFDICPHCHKFRHAGCLCERGQYERER